MIEGIVIGVAIGLIGGSIIGLISVIVDIYRQP